MMTKYHICYETDYCDDFPEQIGECEIVAESEDKALKEFYEIYHAKCIPIEIREIKK